MARDPEALLVVSLLSDWERGVLPDSGGVLDQPAALVDALRWLTMVLGQQRKIESGR